MSQTRIPMNLYRTPFTPAYWREANACAKALKLLMFAALMVAMTRALSLIPGHPHRPHQADLGAFLGPEPVCPGVRSHFGPDFCLC